METSKDDVPKEVDNGNNEKNGDNPPEDVVGIAFRIGRRSTVFENRVTNNGVNWFDKINHFL
jgi:hypothetical protein